jgi:hypothetical protein
MAATLTPQTCLALPTQREEPHEFPAVALCERLAACLLQHVYRLAQVASRQLLLGCNQCRLRTITCYFTAERIRTEGLHES